MFQEGLDPLIFIVIHVGNLVQPSTSTDGFPAPPITLPEGRRSLLRLLSVTGAERWDRVGRRARHLGAWAAEAEDFEDGVVRGIRSAGAKREALSLVTGLSAPRQVRKAVGSGGRWTEPGQAASWEGELERGSTELVGKLSGRWICGMGQEVTASGKDNSGSSRRRKWTGESQEG